VRARAAALMEIKSYAKAAEDYDRLIAAEPGNAQAYYQRGLAREQEHQRDKALADYKQAVARDANFADARAAVARLTPPPPPPPQVRKPEPRVAAKTKPEPKQHEAKVEPKPEPKIEQKVEPKVEAKSEPKLEAKPDVKADEPKAKVEAPKAKSEAPQRAAAVPPAPVAPPKQVRATEPAPPPNARERTMTAQERAYQRKLKREFEAEDRRERQIKRKLVERRAAERRASTYYAPPEIRYYRAGTEPSRKATFSDVWR